MLNIDYLHVLSALLTVGEPDEAKKAAARLLDEDMTHVSELWTIARCAAILDSSAKLAIGKAKLDRFARELGDEHRAELVRFCRDETGHRPRRTTVTLPEPKNPLSIHHDTRPGFEDSDAQPAGLIVRPDEYEQRRQQRQANTLAGLTRSLRDSVRQLPPHIRTALREIDTARTTSRAPRNRAQHRRALHTRRMERLADDYIRTRLGVEDHTAFGLRTIFDVDDDNHRRLIAPRAMAPRIAEIRDEIQARKAAENPDTARAEATPDTTNRRSTEIHDPDDDPTAPIPGYEFDYTKAAQYPIRTTPCVSCWTERRPQDVRTVAHTNGYDDSLCGECRTNGYAGLPKPRPVRVRCTVAYLNPADRAQATAEAARTAAVIAPCATAAAHLPKGAAKVWLRAYSALASETDRPTIDQWVLAWLDSAQPQPPTTPAPAAPAPVLAAA